MKISAIGNNVFYSNRTTYSPNFTGYYDVVLNGTKDSVKNIDNVEYLFGELIKEIDKDVFINKSAFFEKIKQIFKVGGLKGIFETLKKTSNNDILIDKVVKKAKNQGVVPIADSHGSIMDIISYGGNEKDIRLGFSAGLKKGNIEFYVDKKGDLFMDRSYGKKFVSTGFYSDTGTKKVEVTSYAGGKPDKIYYNKDGSKPFFKNWLLGGTPVEGMY